MGNKKSGSEGRRVARSGRGGIEPLWDPSKAVACAFEWRREGQLEPMLERLIREQGESALWRFGIACVEPFRSTHELMPQVLEAASRGFKDPKVREELRRRYGGTMVGAFTIGMKNSMPGAASFVAGYSLLEGEPIASVSLACAFARIATAFRTRGRVLAAFPSRGDELRSKPGGPDENTQRAALDQLISIDAEMAKGLLARVNRVGGERTRLLIGRLAEIEGEALAWLEQTTLLEAMLESKGEFQ